MAKLNQLQTHAARCTACNTPAKVTVESQPYRSGDPIGFTSPIVKVEYLCDCRDSGVTNYTNLSISKEVPVAKVYDTTEVKSVALNTIMSKVQQLERALYNRVDALAKAEAEHNKLIADASNALNRVLAESIHSGIGEDDFEVHLPDLQDDLSERLISIINDMSLANVLEGV